MPAYSPLVIASHNQGKVREIRTLLAPLGIEVESAGDHDLPEPDETGDTFEANAAIKSESACLLSGQASLADDSGLCIPALDDAPGIYSARWAGPDKDFSLAMDSVRKKIEQKGLEAQGAEAYFVCVLSLSALGQETEFFRGEVHGTLTFPPRGEKGFGYDPIFIPNGHDVTFAEMDTNKKQKISHRAEAFKRFVAYLDETSKVA